MFCCINKKCSHFNFSSEGLYCSFCGTTKSLVKATSDTLLTTDRDYLLLDFESEIEEKLALKPNHPSVKIDYLSLDFEAEIDKLTSEDVSLFPLSKKNDRGDEVREIREIRIEETLDIVPKITVSAIEGDDTMAFFDRQMNNRFKRKTPEEFSFNYGNPLVLPKRVNSNFTQVLNTDNVGLQMQFIPSGIFLMGNNDSSVLTETPVRTIEVPAFYVSIYLITQLQYQAIVGTNPAKFENLSNPVEQVSFCDAIEYCRILKNRTGKSFRLLSEAEWEYACRADTKTAYYFGDLISTDLCCYSPISRDRDREYSTAPVGKYKPNDFGLYDMHGNVWEWCLDNWHRDYNEAPLNHQPWFNEKNQGARIVRGGAWNEPDIQCRSSSRDRRNADIICSNIGFRVACDF